MSCVSFFTSWFDRDYNIWTSLRSAVAITFYFALIIAWNLQNFPSNSRPWSLTDALTYNITKRAVCCESPAISAISRSRENSLAQPPIISPVVRNLFASGRVPKLEQLIDMIYTIVLIYKHTALLILWCLHDCDQVAQSQFKPDFLYCINSIGYRIFFMGKSSVIIVKCLVV